MQKYDKFLLKKIQYKNKPKEISEEEYINNVLKGE